MLQWPEGMPWNEFKEQLSIFSSEVMPEFAGREAALVAGDD